MRIKVGDSRLFFDIEGAKLRPDGPRMREVPTVVLLHGGPGFDHSGFKPDLSPLADEDAQLLNFIFQLPSVWPDATDQFAQCFF